MVYVLAYDVGTTGVKTCLFQVGDAIRLLESAHEGYGLYMTENGGAEQDAREYGSYNQSFHFEIWTACGRSLPTGSCIWRWGPTWWPMPRPIRPCRPTARSTP